MTSLKTVLSSRRLPALDGLRAVAVAIVILYHAGLGRVPGDLGVTGFFVLSGFLITWLLLKELAGTGEIDFKGFYWRRTLRIFPAYFTLVGLTLIGDLLLGLSWTPGRLLAAATYTINYHNAFFGHVGPIAHGWSLAVEEQFYLLWPAAFLWLAVRNRLIPALSLVIAGVVAWRSLLVFGGAPTHYVYNALETRFDSLAIGCLLAVLVTLPDFVSKCERLAVSAWSPVPTLVLLFISRTQLGEVYHYTLGFTVDSLLIAVLIVQLLQFASSPAWRWLEWRVITWIGVLSYPLYLWHISALEVGRKIPGGVVVQAVAGVLLSLALAASSYYGVEKYFLRLKSRRHRIAVAGTCTTELTSRSSAEGDGSKRLRGALG